MKITMRQIDKKVNKALVRMIQLSTKADTVVSRKAMQRHFAWLQIKERAQIQLGVR